MVILRRRKGSVSNENKETISDSKDCEKIKVTLALMTELEKGEDSAREEGWISADEVEKTLGIK